MKQVQIFTSLVFLLTIGGTTLPGEIDDLVSQSPDPNPAASQAPDAFEILWDQTGNPSGSCAPTQDFLDLGAVVQAADDFIITESLGWTIQQVFIDGVYSLGDGPAGSWDIYIYDNDAGDPGDLVYSDLNITAAADDAGNVILDLPEPAVLTGGAYWISVAPNLAFSPGNQQFFWCGRNIQTGQPYHWRDPQGIFGLGCISWSPGSNCLGTTFPDLLFSLGGHLNGLDFVVDSTVDSHDGFPGNGICADSGGSCTLRAAIEETNASGGADVIFIPPGNYALDLGPLTVLENLSITGAGPEATTIDGQGLSNLLVIGDVTHAVSFDISRLTLTNGNAPLGVGGGAIAFHFGSNGVLVNIRVVDNVSAGVGGVTGKNIVIRDSLFQNNVGIVGGASISLGQISHSRFIGNTGLDGAGGVELTNGMIQNSVIVENISGRHGGGVYAFGEIVIEQTLIANNSADNAGGGIFYSTAGGDLTITNTTISGNTAGSSGGGIRFSASFAYKLYMTNITITANVADSDADGNGNGGGFTNLGSDLENVFMRNSILYGNIDISGEAPDCEGTIVSLDYNIVGDLTACSLLDNLTNTLIGVDPMLLPLAENGGFSWTHALAAGSPAIGTGSCKDQNDILVLQDQRGFLRPPSECDIGAYEDNPYHGALLPLTVR